MSEQSYSRVPEAVDAWRMVAARREFEGRIPLATMVRLRDSLLQPEGDARYVLAFGIDALKVPFAELRIEAELPLGCHRMPSPAPPSSLSAPAARHAGSCR